MNQKNVRHGRKAQQGSRSALGKARDPVVEQLEARALFNAITAENALPGTSQSVWDIPVGTADPTLQGFATSMSVNVGNTVAFKITDNTLAQYTINIYRMGYYQGNGARLVATIASTQITAKLQPNPIINSATGEEDCGNWSVSATWNVPTAAVSGVYFAEMVRSDTGGKSRIPFVVRNDSSQSNILVQTADQTWEAYNYYGTPTNPLSGKSLYDGIGQATQADAVSYNRPLVEGDLDPNGAINSFFFSEYPMVRFLEQNGYDVSYFTGADADNSTTAALIKNHKEYLTAGHDEYWSGNQVNNVTAARDAGVNLAFFSGNEISWKTRFGPSIDGSNTPGRTLVCYKMTASNGVVDPLYPAVSTGLWLDPAFGPPSDGGHPQNALSGTLYQVNWYNDGSHTGFNAAITVPASNAGSEFWRNTAVANLQPGQTYTTVPGYLGYEWDVDADNGSRPAGLMDLSSTTINIPFPYSAGNGGMFINSDNAYGPGTATHSLTLYRAASGALVFGAGTIQYSWALDTDHLYQATSSVKNVPVDKNLQQATVNLFAEMGIVAGSLEAGLIQTAATTDNIAPKSIITSPTPNSKYSGAVTITGTAADSGGGVVAGVEVSTDGGNTWHPATGRNTWSYTWVPPSTGTFTIKSRAVDDSGNLEASSAGVTVAAQASGLFSTSAAPTALQMDVFDPNAANVGGVELGTQFQSDTSGMVTGVRFWKSDRDIRSHSGELWSSTGQLLATASFTNETSEGWQQVNFSQPVAIAANTTYTVSFQNTSGTFSYARGAFATPLNNAPLHLVGNSGVYNYDTSRGTPGFPTISNAQSPNYWVDVVFTTTPTAPTNLTAVATAPTQVTLSWTASTGAVTAYHVERSSNGINFTEIAGNVQGTTYTDTTALANVAYTYQVRAENSGFFSGYTNAKQVTTAPAAPTGLAAIMVTSSGISLGWTAPLGATGYQVLRKGPIDSGYVQIGTSTTPSYSDLSCAAGTTYSYEVVATSSAGSSTASSPLWVTTASSSSAPATPANLTATASAGGIALQWTANTESNLAGYNVLRASSAAGPFTQLNAALLTSPSYNDINAPLGAVSYYQVVAVNTSALSSAPATVNATRPAAAGAATSIFASTAGPASNLQNVNDPGITTNGGVEVGIKFRSDVAGTVTGVRFYKGSLSTGVHTGELWSSTGTLLATATFANETAGGWQQVSFSIPVAINANTTYIVSYHTTAPYLAYTPNAFATTGVDNAPLHALASGVDGSNGVYHYDTAPGVSTFPTVANGQSPNYWVDVVFNVAAPAAVSLMSPTSAPASNLQNVYDAGIAAAGGVDLGLKFQSDVAGTLTAVRFWKGSSGGGVQIGELWNSTGTLLATATFTNESASGWQQVTFSNLVAIAAHTTYIVSYNTTSPYIAYTPNTFATAGIDNGPLHGLQSGVDGSNGAYHYDATPGASIFPSLTNSQNPYYWVDVVFQPSGS